MCVGWGLAGDDRGVCVPGVSVVLYVEVEEGSGQGQTRLIINVFCLY